MESGLILARFATRGNGEIEQLVVYGNFIMNGTLECSDQRYN